MAYPRLLKLDEEIEDKLKSFLMDAITLHNSERSEFDAELTKLQEDYDAEPVEKDFPFKNACGLVIPIFAISFETIHASIMGTLLPFDHQIIEVSPGTEEYTDHAYHFGNFGNRYLKKDVKIRQNIESSYIDMGKYGTGVAKAVYEKVTKFGMKEENGVEVEFPVTIKDGVALKHVPIGRFILPFDSQDPQLSKIVGETHHLTYNTIERLERDGLFYEGTAAKLKGTGTVSGSENQFEEKQEELEKREPGLPNRPTFYELWMEFVVDGDPDDDAAIPKEIQVFWSKDQNLIMGCFYNQHDDLHRCYRVGHYVKVEGRTFGIGIGKQSDTFQREITIQHRQRIDNATIANIRMFKVSKMSGYGPAEPIMAGKLWFLDDMKDLETLQLGEIYPSSYNNEQQVLLYQQQRVGSNELTQGMPQVGTPGTATSDMARLQEAKRKFDYVLNNYREFTSEVVDDVFDLVKQYKLARYTSGIEASFVNQILSAPVQTLRDGLIVEIDVVGDQKNKILDAQKWDQIAPKLQSYYGSMFQLALQSGNQQMAALIIKKAVMGGTEAMKQILELADVKNIDSFLLTEIMQMMQQPQQPPQQQLPPGQPPQVMPPQGGMVQ